MDLRAYFAGFVDGEGCFTVSFSPRSKLLIGWEVRPSFSVSQNADRSEVLLLMREYFGCGSTDLTEATIRSSTRCAASTILVERIIPFFEANPLLSSKQRDFERFAEVCRLVRNRAHRTEPGLREIVGLAMAMNSSRKRKFAPEAIFPTGAEVIVSATSNGGPKRSSDPHEWRNDLSAVSTRGSAKLNWP